MPYNNDKTGRHSQPVAAALAPANATHATRAPRHRAAQSTPYPLPRVPTVISPQNRLYPISSIHPKSSPKLSHFSHPPYHTPHPPIPLISPPQKKHQKYSKITIYFPQLTKPLTSANIHAILPTEQLNTSFSIWSNTRSAPSEHPSIFPFTVHMWMVRFILTRNIGSNEIRRYCSLPLHSQLGSNTLQRRIGTKNERSDKKSVAL